MSVTKTQSSPFSLKGVPASPPSSASGGQASGRSAEIVPPAPADESWIRPPADIPPPPM